MRKDCAVNGQRPTGAKMGPKKYRVYASKRYNTRRKSVKAWSKALKDLENSGAGATGLPMTDNYEESECTMISDENSPEDDVTERRRALPTTYLESDSSSNSDQSNIRNDGAVEDNVQDGDPGVRALADQRLMDLADQGLMDLFSSDEDEMPPVFLDAENHSNGGYEADAEAYLEDIHQRELPLPSSNDASDESVEEMSDEDSHDAARKKPGHEYLR